MRLLFFFVLFFALDIVAYEPNINRRFVADYQSASSVGSQALWQNPAGLFFLDGYETSYTYFHEWNALGPREHLQGNLAVNLYETLSLGLGLSSGMAFQEQARTSQGTDLHAIVAAAVKLGPRSALGLSALKSYNFLRQAGRPWAITLGFQSRLSQHFALGGSYENAGSSFMNAPNLTLGASVRPFLESFTLGIDSQWRARGAQVYQGFSFDPKISLKTMFAGIGTFVSAEFTDVLKQFSLPIFAAGLDINLELAGASVFGLTDIAKQQFAVGASLRTSNAEWESISPRRDYWVYLDLSANGTLEEKPRSLASRLFYQGQDPLMVLAMLNRIANDDGVSGVAIKINNVSFGDGRTEEWRNALEYIKQKNKYVLIYLESPDARDYYIATAANKIFINKNSSLSMRRLQTTLIYLKDSLAKIGIEAEEVTAGTYKTAPRMFTQSQPKKEEVEVAKNLLDNFYNSLVNETATARGLEPQALQKIFDLGEIDASAAKLARLVDDAIYEDEITTIISDIAGPTPVYHSYQNRLFKDDSWGVPPKIAVIPVSGTIVSGRVTPSLFPTTSTMVGDLDVIDEIDKAVNDPLVKGIIMRINSPGGSSLASHNINRALTEAQKSKPVVSSMADVAASGGYLIAAPTHIIAEPNTITGSIGVFSLYFSGEELTKKIGLNKKEISPIKDPGPTLFRGLTQGEKEVAQQIVAWHYHNFIASVASGLELPPETVEKVAQGRVWLGAEAFERKLVHELGGFFEAISAVRLLADMGTDEAVALEILNPGSSTTMLMSPDLAKSLTPDAALQAFEAFNPLMTTYQSALEAYRLRGAPQARLPFNVDRQ